MFAEKKKPARKEIDMFQEAYTVFCKLLMPKQNW